MGFSVVRFEHVLVLVHGLADVTSLAQVLSGVGLKEVTSGIAQGTESFETQHTLGCSAADRFHNDL